MIAANRFAAAVSIAVVAALAAPAAARADDIIFSGGRDPIKNVEIVSESYEKVVYKIQGSNQEEPTGNIAEVIRANKDTRYRGAEDKFRRGDLNGAIGDFRIVIDAPRPRPEHEWQKHYALFFLGEAYRMTGDSGKAIDAYERLLKDNEKSRFYGPAKLGLGLCKLARGDRAGARALFSELEGEAKSKKLGERWEFAALLANAEVLEAEGKIKDALERYRKVANSAITSGGKAGNAGTRAAIHVQRLMAKDEPGKADAAAGSIQKQIEDEYKKPSPDVEVAAAAYNALGDVYTAKDDHKRALLAYLRVAVDEDLKKSGEERPKALYCAAAAFEKAKVEDWKNRSDMLKAELRAVYPGSAWAAKLGGK